MRSSTLFIAAMLDGLAFAQNSTSSSNDTCSGTLGQRQNAATGSINATGSESITWTSVANIDRDDVKPWYISVLVNNTNQRVDNGGTISWPFLSVPDGVEANACVYQFGAQNATSTGDVEGSVGCGGVFTGKCIDYLRESVLNNTSGISGTPPRCNLPTSTDDELKRTEEACGDIGRRFSLVRKWLSPLSHILHQLTKANQQWKTLETLPQLAPTTNSLESIYQTVTSRVRSVYLYLLTQTRSTTTRWLTI